jgi:hypothetical protein
MNQPLCTLIVDDNEMMAKTLQDSYRLKFIIRSWARVLAGLVGRQKIKRGCREWKR